MNQLLIGEAIMFLEQSFQTLFVFFCLDSIFPANCVGETTDCITPANRAVFLLLSARYMKTSQRMLLW